jgi:hypothetical protein
MYSINTSAGEISIHTARDEHGDHMTTVYRDGKTAGYIRHRTLWAVGVIERAGKRARGYVHYSEGGFVVGSIPAAIDSIVADLIARQRDDIRAARGC